MATKATEIELVIKLPAAIKHIADSLGLSLGDISAEMIKGGLDYEIDRIQEMEQHETGSILVDTIIKKLNHMLQQDEVIEWVGRTLITTEGDGDGDDGD